MMNNRLYILAVIGMMALSTHAQVITWAVKPGTYSKIEPCWGDLYLVHKGDAIGVISGDGRTVIAPDASRITGFYGGLALALKSDGGQERILGILSTDGSYVKVDGTYFTIPYQEFFSEGLLTITTPRGQAGYMNANGVVVKSFQESFVSPFSEGYAVVGENENFSLIDKGFNKIRIQLGTVSQVYGGSNVYRGSAIIWDGNGKFYNFDVNRGICKKISEPRSLDYDYMYCFSCISNRTANVPYEQPTRTAQSLEPIENGGKFGYAANGKTILPYQFEQAESFHGNHAIVMTGGKYALLMLHNSNETFDAKAASDIEYKKSEGNSIVHRFSVSLPSLWDENNLTIKVKDENGIPVSITNNSGAYEFNAKGATGTKKYAVEIEGNGMQLWNGEIAYNYKVKADPIIYDEARPLTVKLNAANTHADKDNRCYVKATIHNPNPDPITATVSMKGSNLLEAVNKRITIPAYGSKDVSTYFTVTKASSGQKVTVTTSAGGSDTLDGLQLIPF